MCEAIRFRINEQSITFRISDKSPCLPIRMRNGNIIVMPWGNVNMSSTLYPEGHTAHIDHIRAKRWLSYWPKSVRICCDAYLMIDKQGNERWHQPEPGKGLRGVAVTVFGDDRVYVLMRNPEILDASDQKEWPIYIPC